jgi:hypothetical protein
MSVNLFYYLDPVFTRKQRVRNLRMKEHLFKLTRMRTETEKRTETRVEKRTGTGVEKRTGTGVEKRTGTGVEKRTGTGTGTSLRIRLAGPCKIC